MCGIHWTTQAVFRFYISCRGLQTKKITYRTKDCWRSNHTYYFEADDDHMRYFGIMKGSIIIVDKSTKVGSGMLIVCSVEDEWLTRKLLVSGDNTYLCINDGMEAYMNISGKNITVFGAVTWTCLPHSKQHHVPTGRL